MSNAHRRLQWAIRCAQLARNEEGGDPNLFRGYLEASIEAARSVTWLLQKEFKDTPGFAEWYQSQQAAMANEPLMQFFRNLRNVVVKEGPAPLTRPIRAAAAAIMSMEAFGTARVIRGSPWYRRPPSVLWEDLDFGIRQRLRLFLRKLRRWIEARFAHPAPQAAKVEILPYYFSDAAWQMKPALELIEDYIARLNDIVTGAERKFEEQQAPKSS